MAGEASTEVIPLDRLPGRLFANILRFTDVSTQKAFSETCKTFSKWARVCSQSMYELDRHTRETQEQILAVLNERLKARNPQEFRKIDKKAMALSATISPEKRRYVDTHSTLFARTFAQAVQKNPGRFLQNGRPSQTVLDVFYWMPEKIVKAIDEELDSDEFKRSLELVALSDSGKLAEYVKEHREDLLIEYERHLLLTYDVELDQDTQSADSGDDLDSSESENSHDYSDETLRNYVLRQVKGFRQSVLKMQKDLPVLREELASKIQQITSSAATGSAQIEEPEVKAGLSSPRFE